MSHADTKDGDGLIEVDQSLKVANCWTTHHGITRTITQEKSIISWKNNVRMVTKVHSNLFFSFKYIPPVSKMCKLKGSDSRTLKIKWKFEDLCAKEAYSLDFDQD